MDLERRPGVTLSRECEVCLNLAVSEAARRSHGYVTVEHMLYALLFDRSAAAALRHAGGSIKQTREALEEFFAAQMPQETLATGALPQPTIAFQRTIQRAANQVQASGRTELGGASLLIAMFGEEDSFAVYFLERQGVTRFELVEAVAHGGGDGGDGGGEEEATPARISGAADPSSQAEEGRPAEEGPTSPEDQEAEGGKKSALPLYATDLNDRARQGRIDPLIGRDAEIERIVHILSRRRKNNPLLIGDAGVGKTALAEGLARRVVDGEVPDALKETVVYALDLGSMLAGSRFRGDFEQRLKKLLRELADQPKHVLFIDEIHTLIGAGSVSGGSLDASNLLKPALASGELRCIGSTTFKEFRARFEGDHGLARRFQPVDVHEPSHADALAILRGVRGQYEAFHGVRFSNEALKSAVELAARYIHERRLPDKAIDVMDEAGAMLALRSGQRKTRTVTVDDIQRVISRMAKLPAHKVTKSDTEALGQLEERLKQLVYGQDPAIEAVATAVKLGRAGLGPADKPVGSFLFTGPTGVGKTEVARRLAEVLGVHFVRFDMSEYMERHAVARLIGAPPGYVGFDQGGLLTDAVYQNPHVVLLLDEIEKAHPDVHNILLQVMDHGALTDNNGRKTDFRHVILIMTTNAGARELLAGSIGFARGKVAAAEGGESSALKEAFTPEFRNRIDAIIPFGPLSEATLLRVVDKFVAELAAQLAERKVKLELTEPARRWLGERGYSEVYGARPLARVITDELRRPLVDDLLFGQLKGGGRVRVAVEDGALAFEVVPRG